LSSSVPSPPVGAPAGSYRLQGRAYSSDTVIGKRYPFAGAAGWRAEHPATSWRCPTS